MTDAEKLSMLRAMGAAGEGDTNEILSAYLSLAASKVIAQAYPYRDDVKEVPEKYEYVQLEIAAYLLNKRGAEGQTSHSENGISRQYENADIPASMLRSITPHVGTFSSDS